MWIPSDPNQIKDMVRQFVAQLAPDTRVKVGLVAQAVLEELKGGAAPEGQAGASPASPAWLLTLIQRFAGHAPPPRSW
jgi:hypothetical protein